MQHTKTKMMKRTKKLHISPIASILLILFLGLTAFAQGMIEKSKTSVSNKANYQITGNSVGEIKIGMTIGEVEKLVNNSTLGAAKSFDTETIDISSGDADKDGTIVYKKQMSFTVAQGAINFDDDSEDAPLYKGDPKILGIDIPNSQYKTAAGVHPNMTLQEAEKKYGKIKLIFKEGSRGPEYLIFTNHPKGLDFAVGNKQTSMERAFAGVYSEGYDTTTKYTPGAFITSINIPGRYDDLSQSKFEDYGKNIQERLRHPFDSKTEICTPFDKLPEKTGDKPNIGDKDTFCWKAKALSGDKNLQKGIFIFSDLVGANLSQTDMHGSMITYTSLRNVNFTGADLVGVNFIASNLDGADFTNANLTRADLRGTKLRNATLTGTILEGADLSGQDFSKMNFAGRGFSSNNLSKANFKEANLNDSGFSADLTDADFTGADLTDASFQGSLLQNTNFTKANLTNANLQFVDLTKANLTGATLKGATVSKARTKGVDFDDWKKRGGIVVD